jgi:tetratricopeptide (TPR) repeat protein
VKARALTLAALVAGASAASAQARADNALRPERIPTKARQLAEKGRAFHNAGDYAAAVAAFKEAYVLAPSPGLLFNIAQSYRLAGNCDESAWMYRRFLDTNPVGEHRALAEAHLSAVEKCGSGGLRMSPPDPKQVAAAVPEPETQLVTFTDAPDRRSRAYKKLGLGVAIGGGALLAGAAIFAVDARDAANTVADTYKRGGKWDDIKDTDARGKRSAEIATVLGIGGGLAVASGAVLFAVGRHYEQAQHVAITPTTRGAQVSLSWGF